MIYVSIFLALSILMNILLLWYIKGVLTKLLFISETSGDLLYALKNFSNHLESIHEMETFYGEPILQNLIQHSRHIVDEVKNYGEIYILTDEPDDLEEQDVLEEEREEEREDDSEEMFV